MENLKKKMEDDAMHLLTKHNPSNQDLRDILRLIICKMWSEERLAEYIHQVHDSLCENCPHVKNGEGKMSGKLIALISSLVTAVLGLAGAVVKLAMEIK